MAQHRKNRWPGILAPILVFALSKGLALGQAGAQSTSPTETCKGMGTTEFAELLDARTTIVSVAIEPAANGLPAYCKVDGMVAPQVGFELRLPTAGWNGKFLMQGCGFMCGYLNMDACDDGLARDYAVVNTDMGHGGGMGTTSWARNQYGSKIDFGYRATHVVALASKALIARYYGKPARFSYFRGCSTGGRQAMVEAQRFPNDFDGIIAGGAVLDETGDGLLHLVWSGRASLDAEGHQILSPAKVEMLHKAVMKACDGLDGSTDGVIQDPMVCSFKLASLQCKGGDAAGCLTDREIAAVQLIYAGAHNARGEKLYPGGMMFGSEMEWIPLFVGVGGQLPNYLQKGMTQVFRDVFLAEDPGPDFSLQKVDFERFNESLGVIEPIYDARNPDLSAFKRHGGKLIVYHGWDDAEIPPGVAIDYYDKVTRLMGGEEAMSAFYRLFLVPGMAHCRRGPGADAIDYMSALEAWVERGIAPDSLMAYHPKVAQAYNGLPPLRYPLAVGSYSWSRPVFPYPQSARYRGRGDVNLPESWIAASGKP